MFAGPNRYAALFTGPNPESSGKKNKNKKKKPDGSRAAVTSVPVVAPPSVPYSVAMPQSGSGGTKLTDEEARKILHEHRIDMPVPPAIKVTVQAEPPSGWSTFWRVTAYACEKASWGLAYNLGRDAEWTDTSDRNDAYFNGTTYDPTTRILTDFARGLLAMVALAAAKQIVARCLLKQKPPTLDDVKSIPAAAIAIPLWDLASNAATGYYLNAGYDAITAGYRAWWAPGLVEGPTQWFVPKVVDAIVDLFSTREGLRAFLKDPKGTIKQAFKPFMKELFLNAGPGSIPGDVWQVVYNRCVELGYSVPVASMLVALAVGACNLVFSVATTYTQTKKELEDQDGAPASNPKATPLNTFVDHSDHTGDHDFKEGPTTPKASAPKPVPAASAAGAAVSASGHNLSDYGSSGPRFIRMPATNGAVVAGTSAPTVATGLGTQTKPNGYGAVG